MEQKKFKLNKKTVSNLSFEEQLKVRAGEAITVNTCAMTAEGCLTNFTCTELPFCQCTYLCTMTCRTDP
jgi:hypothetical protein